MKCDSLLSQDRPTASQADDCNVSADAFFLHRLAPRVPNVYFFDFEIGRNLCAKPALILACHMAMSAASTATYLVRGPYKKISPFVLFFSLSPRIALAHVPKCIKSPQWCLHRSHSWTNGTNRHSRPEALCTLPALQASTPTPTPTPTLISSN